LQGMTKLFSKQATAVVAHEKIHGTNFRCGYIPTAPRGIWQRLLRALHLSDRHTFVFGSHNVVLSNHMLQVPRLGNPYARAVIQYNLRDILEPGEIVFGEVYGPSIQKGYHYGLKNDEIGLVVFDVLIDGVYLSPYMLRIWLDARGLPSPPMLYIGDYSMQAIRAVTTGNSVLCPGQKVIEGAVVRSMTSDRRLIAKYLNPDYLMLKGTEFH